MGILRHLQHWFTGRVSTSRPPRSYRKPTPFATGPIPFRGRRWSKR